MSTVTDITSSSAVPIAEAHQHSTVDQAKIVAEHTEIMEVYEDFKVKTEIPALYELDGVINAAFESINFYPTS